MCLGGIFLTLRDLEGGIEHLVPDLALLQLIKRLKGTKANSKLIFSAQEFNNPSSEKKEVTREKSKPLIALANSSQVFS